MTSYHLDTRHIPDQVMGVLNGRWEKRGGGVCEERKRLNRIRTDSFQIVGTLSRRDAVRRKIMLLEIGYTVLLRSCLVCN